jgi:hypothetical protein
VVIGDGSILIYSLSILRNMIIVYFNKEKGMDNCPYHLHIV